ncbi:MAG: dTDP-4-dehydrorhamnose 3,5-epimerase [Bacteroidetes bacterium]|nr:MAG: dTDP-4-dehydrorhamnose 3,5-epimerase [Bacteroidota bacterium]
MKFTPGPLAGIVIIEPRTHSDPRGEFFETYNMKLFSDYGIDTEFCQDNQSNSSKNVIRGLHYQKWPHSQGKLVRVVSGAALDVVLDIRKSSKTFGRHFSIELSAANRKMLWIPEGFAHGFSSFQENTVFLYKVTRYYHPQSDRGIRYDDPELSIDWKVQNAMVSEKDLKLPTWSEFLRNTEEMD